MFVYKTDAQLEAMSAAERDTYAAEKREHEAKIAKADAEAIAKIAVDALKTDLESKITEKDLVIETLKNTVEAQGEKIVELSKSKKTSKEVKTLVEEVEDNIEAIKASTTKGKDATFVVKADTVRASVTGNGYALELPDVGQLAHRRLTVYDMFRKVPVPTNANGTIRYVDWDESTTVRAAAAIAEGGVFPESTAKWITETLTLQKVGDIIPMSEEFMYDAALFASELENFLRTNVDIKIDTDLVTGNGTSANINGLKNQVPNFTPVAAGIVDANLYDLLVKVREAITRPYGSKYSPNVALMNITDINKMKLKKDTQNNYILPPFYNQNGQLVDGISVLECNTMAANTMIVGDSRYGAIYEIPGVVVETGYATGDFESDMMSLKARKRLNLLVRRVDRTGWLEVTSISAALVTLAT